MALVLYGKETVEVLEKWANELFISVPNKNISLPQLKPPVFSTNSTITNIIPVKNTKALRLVWALPSLVNSYGCKPDGYLSHLLGHEGKNSLLSYLKHENLAERLTSYHDDIYTTASLIFIEIKLTQKGLKEYEYILEIVYAYINYLQSEPAQQWVFEELKAVAYSEFLFRSKQDPFWYVQKLSSRLEKYPASRVLTAPELYFEFDAALVKEVIGCLSLNNLQVYLLSQSHDKTDLIEEVYYKTLHKTFPIPEELVKKLKSPNVNQSEIQLGYPTPNPYITTVHSILSSEKEKHPTELIKSERLRVWHKKDTKFNIDKVFGQVIIYSNSCRFDVSAYIFVLAEIWNKILKERLREEIYLADIAGLKHDIEIDNHGLRITLNGFSEKYPKFFEFLIKAVADFLPSPKDEKAFDDIKNEYIVILKNYYFAKPYEQAQRSVYEANLTGGYFTLAEKLKAIESIEFADILWFAPKWLKNVYFEWLVIGNIKADVVLNMANTCVDLFVEAKSSSFLLPEEFLTLHVTKVPKNTEILYRALVKDENDTNSAAVSQWQFGAETDSLQGLLYLLENFLQEPCFNVLRTKEQLGYIVSSYTHKIRGILNIIILVQSSVKCPAYIFNRVSEFITAMHKEVNELDDEKYAKIVKSTLEGSLKKDISLKEEYMRYKFEVDSAAYCFERRKKIKDVIKSITKEDFRKAFTDKFVTNPRRLNIEMLNSGMKQEEKETLQESVKVFENLSDFKRNQNVWPQVYIRK